MLRSKKSQTKHDKKIRDLAKEYKDKGYDVKADIPGYKSPETIYGKRPDLIAKKKGHETAIEIETPDSVDSTRDKKQQKAFKNWRNRKTTRHYKRIVTDR
jgi:hypothetical protein